MKCFPGWGRRFRKNIEGVGRGGVPRKIPAHPTRDQTRKKKKNNKKKNKNKTKKKKKKKKRDGYRVAA